MVEMSAVLSAALSVDQMEPNLASMSAVQRASKKVGNLAANLAD